MFPVTFPVVILFLLFSRQLFNRNPVNVRLCYNILNYYRFIMHVYNEWTTVLRETTVYRGTERNIYYIVLI